ncbi:MAG: hypothetical protein NT129_01755 [Candidatus Aenigmarchaeota archaeon]|nr:hypothetical protein [Candidatus Aenigmarchaeota archaeon]
MPREEDRSTIILQELVRRSNDESRRLRELEQRVQAIEERTASLEETNLDRIKKINSKLFDVDKSIRDMGIDITNLINNIEKINKQISTFARRRDIKEVEKMFELLSPIRQEFVTKEELEKELRRV